MHMSLNNACLVLNLGATDANKTVRDCPDLRGQPGLVPHSLIASRFITKLLFTWYNSSLPLFACCLPPGLHSPCLLELWLSTYFLLNTYDCISKHGYLTHGYMIKTVLNNIELKNYFDYLFMKISLNKIYIWLD